MLIRPARSDDRSAIWRIIEPVIRAGDTYTIDPDLSEDAALAYWLSADKEYPYGGDRLTVVSEVR